MGPPKMSCRSLMAGALRVAGGAEGAIIPPRTADAADEVPVEPES